MLDEDNEKVLGHAVKRKYCRLEGSPLRTNTCPCCVYVLSFGKSTQIKSASDILYLLVGAQDDA
jgi:hypothetical protein